MPSRMSRAIRWKPRDPLVVTRLSLYHRIVRQVLGAWAAGSAADLPIYAAGSAGSSDADTLFADDARRSGDARGWRPVAAADVEKSSGQSP